MLRVDYGSEYIIGVVAELLEKLRIEFTKNRTRQADDQALVECKNGSIVRKQRATEGLHGVRQRRYRPSTATRNVYLNYLLPCGYAAEVVNRKGRIRKRYDSYLTPYERFRSLSHPPQHLRPGRTMTELKRIAQAHGDTEYALLVKRVKAELFRRTPRLVARNSTSPSSG